MREYERQALSQYFDSLLLAITEVRVQYLKSYLWKPLPDRVDTVAEVPSAPIEQVIAINTCNNQVFQFHFFGHLSQSRRLVWVRSFGLARCYGAELAVARADVAQNKDRRRPPRPALTQIGTIGVTTNSLDPERIQNILCMPECSVGGQRPAQPGGQPPGLLSLKLQFFVLLTVHS